MTDRQKSWIIFWGVLAVMIAVSGFWRIAFPIPVPPVPTSVTSQGFIYPPGAIYIEEGGKNQVFSSYEGGRLETEVIVVTAHELSEALKLAQEWVSSHTSLRYYRVETEYSLVVDSWFITLTWLKDKNHPYFLDEE